MKKLHSLMYGLFAIAIAFSGLANAQTVQQLPQFVAPQTIFDNGNGPIEFRMLTGSMALFTSQASGTGGTSGSSTSLTLNSSQAANPPCVGCGISGTGITAGTTITAFNGTTGITLSAVATVATPTTLSWGKACPVAPPAPTNPSTFIQAGVGADVPFYTYARVCSYGASGPGGQFLSFPIGAH